MTTQKQRPAHEIRLGSVKAAIWANRSEKSGTWYTVTFTRLYKVKDVWKRTGAFGVHDLPILNRLAEDASHWIRSRSVAPIALTAEPDSPAVAQ